MLRQWDLKILHLKDIKRNNILKECFLKIKRTIWNKKGLEKTPFESDLFLELNVIRQCESEQSPTKTDEIVRIHCHRLSDMMKNRKLNEVLSSDFFSCQTDFCLLIHYWHFWQKKVVQTGINIFLKLLFSVLVHSNVKPRSYPEAEEYEIPTKKISKIGVPPENSGVQESYQKIPDFPGVSSEFPRICDPDRKFRIFEPVVARTRCIIKYVCYCSL